MAGKPGPSQRFPSNIIRIAFSTLGGVVILWWQMKDGILLTTPPQGTRLSAPALLDAVVSLSVVNPLLPDIAMIGGYPANVPNQTNKKNVDVTNPFTIDMLAKYVTWSAEPPKQRSITTAGKTGDLYIVDTANWQLVYAGHIGDRISPIVTRDQAIALFQAQMTAIGNDPSKVGVQLEQAFFNGQVQDLPNLPDPFTIQVFAESGWSWHSEPGEVTPAKYGLNAGGSLVINLLQLRAMMEDKKATSVTIPVSIPSSTQAGITFAAQARTAGKKTDDNEVPTMDENGFIDTAWDDKISLLKPSGGTVQMTITFAHKDKLGKLIPPSVSFDSNVTEGGNVIG